MGRGRDTEADHTTLGENRGTEREGGSGSGSMGLGHGAEEEEEV